MDEPGGHEDGVLAALVSPVAESTHLALDVGVLFDAHGAWVHRVAQRLTGSASAADDVVQEVFVLAHRRSDELQAQVGIRTWLYRSTINVARQQRRSARRYGQLLDRFRALFGADVLGPEHDLAQVRNAKRIRDAVATLSDGFARQVPTARKF